MQHPPSSSQPSFLPPEPQLTPPPYPHLQHQPPPQPQPQPPSMQPPTMQPPWATPPPRKGPSGWLIVGVAVALAVIVMVGASTLLLGGRPQTAPTPQPSTLAPGWPTSPPSTVPMPSFSVAPRPGSVPTIWRVPGSTLRPDLEEVRFVSSPTGGFEANALLPFPNRWVLISGNNQSEATVVHGLDPATGEEVWRRPMELAYCADELLDGALICAEATARAPGGPGTSWRLHRLNPATGDAQHTANIDAWLAMLVVRDDRLVILEQRLPAPHAVVRGFDASFEELWSMDLSRQSAHNGMFSENRVFNRPVLMPDGPALDRPRVRTVAGGLTALWIGGSTVFLDVAQGRLVGLLPCSRLVDDGERLWCNEGDRTAVYSYELVPLTKTAPGVRLAFPQRDARAGDITDPVFLDSDGRALRVDLTTGVAVGELAPTANGEAFGLTTAPTTAYVDGITLLSSGDDLFAVNARTGEQLWHVAGQRIDRALSWRGSILLASPDLVYLDPTSGTITAQARQDVGIYTVAVGNQLVGLGLDEIALLDAP